MAMQLPHKHQKQQSLKITPLRMVEHPNAFGAHLEYVRNRRGHSRQEVGDALPEYFKEYNITFPTSNPRDMYYKTEKGVRATQFEELIPLYAALIGCGIRQSAQERHTFVRLARLKLETLPRKRPKLRPDSEWEWLEAELAKIDHQKSPAQSAFDALLSENAFDIGHVVGRETWLKTALSYLHTTPPKKLIIIQAMMGMGKTTCLKLLLHALSEQDRYQPILHLFSDQEDMTSEDHLDNFLATVLAKREVIIPESKVPNREEQIKLLLSDLHKSKERVVLLLDDTQIILDERGQLPSAWQQFFTEFLQRPHQAVIYLATRQWSMWPGRDPIYIVDGDKALLSPLSPEAGIEIWERFGFGDVDAELLKRATERFGGNPRMIELRATNIHRRKLPFSWESSETAPSLAFRFQQKSEHQELIEQLLEDPQIFGAADVEVRQLLEHVVSQHISSDALPILEVLAVSPLALPFPLLSEIIPQAEYALVDLLNTSLLDQTAIANKRAGVQPLTREAVLHTFLLEEGRREAGEQQVSQLYEIWMNQGTFRDEQEQATLIAEAVILYIRQNRLLEAAELLAEHGWLSFAFNHGSRIARFAQDIMESFNGHHADARTEIGGQLLRHHLARFHQRKDMTVEERATVYQRLYELATHHAIEFKPATEIHLIQHIVIHLADKGRFTEAQALIDERIEHIQPIHHTDTFTFSSFLQYQSYVLLKWNEYEEMLELREPLQRHGELARKYLLEEGVDILRQCIDLLRESKYSASHIKKSTIEYRLARRLTDFASYGGKLGLNDETVENALEESIDLKKRGYAALGSLAMAYGEYAQFLATRGQIQKALFYRDLSLQEIEQLFVSKRPSALRERAVLQIDGAYLLLLVGRLDEAQQILEEAKHHVRETTRKLYYRKAEQGLQMISEWRVMSPAGQLDWIWFKRYEEIADYDTHFWLSPAGSFTCEEQQEWNTLFGQKGDDALTRMGELVAASRQRELVSAIDEQREPHLSYPAIPIDEVREKIAEGLQLRKDVETHEYNALIRDLYLVTLDEQLDTLHMIEATHEGDTQTFCTYNHRIYPVPSAYEMDIAANELARILKRGMINEETAPISLSLFHTLQELRLISPRRRLQNEYKQDLQQSRDTPSVSQDLLKMFPIQAIRAFFKSVIADYQFDGWDVVIDPATGNARVEPQIRAVILPNRPMTLGKVLQLLSHEIESHTFRFVSGSKSRVSLLGMGTGGYLPTEEALASFYDRLTAKAQGTEEAETPWIGTLAVGLASGAMRLVGGSVPAHSFYTLFRFFEQYHIFDRLVTGKDTDMATARREAHRLALSRCVRTWRGAPAPLALGVCSGKDHAYLDGHLKLRKAIEKGGEDIIGRLMVGAISVDQLDACMELGINTSAIQHKRLAHDPNISQYIASFENRA
jgi:hypothetical protein